MNSARFPPHVDGRCYWLTGLSGAGKTTLANAFQASLRERSINCIVLDGDEVRAGLNRDLGFSREDRRENVRRIAEIALLLVEKGFYVLVAAISPYEEDRRAARSRFQQGRFIEVHISTDQSTCIARDAKGLYRRAQEGNLHRMTGVDDPYEPPIDPDMRIDTALVSVSDSVRLMMQTLHR